MHQLSWTNVGAKIDRHSVYNYCRTSYFEINYYITNVHNTDIKKVLPKKEF